MNEDQLKKIEQELLNQLDQEVNQDQQIATQAKEIASSLNLQKIAQARIEDRDFVLTYQANKKNITVLAADKNKYQIVGEKYRPYVIQAELDNKFSLKENLEAICESFIRHLTGDIYPEPLQEGDYIQE